APGDPDGRTVAGRTRRVGPDRRGYGSRCKSLRNTEVTWHPCRSASGRRSRSPKRSVTLPKRPVTMRRNARSQSSEMRGHDAETGGHDWPKYAVELIDELRPGSIGAELAAVEMTA